MPALAAGIFLFATGRRRLPSVESSGLKALEVHFDARNSAGYGVRAPPLEKEQGVRSCGSLDQPSALYLNWDIHTAYRHRSG